MSCSKKNLLLKIVLWILLPAFAQAQEMSSQTVLIQSLANPLSDAVAALGSEDGMTSDWILKPSNFEKAISEFGDQIEVIASNNSPEVSRELLLLALIQVKKADAKNILEDPKLAKTLQDAVNGEINQRAKMFSNTTAVISGAVIGFVVYVALVKGASPGKSGSFANGEYLRSHINWFTIALSAGGTATVFYYLNNTGDYAPEKLLNLVDASNEVFNQ